jgi:hypothetical protein
MKTYVGVELQLRLSWPLLPWETAHGFHFVGGCVGSSVDLDALEKIVCKPRIYMKNGVFWVVTPCNNPEDDNLHSHRRENRNS